MVASACTWHCAQCPSSCCNCGESSGDQHRYHTDDRFDASMRQMNTEFESRSLNFADALKFVSERRPHVRPNAGFERQLKHLEEVVSMASQIVRRRAAVVAAAAAAATPSSTTAATESPSSSSTLPRASDPTLFDVVIEMLQSRKPKAELPIDSQ